MKASTEILDSCRSCGQGGLQTILSFGQMPLANRLLTQEQLTLPEPRYPLDFVFCPHCSLAQITTTVDPEELFGEYLYFSSFSETMLNSANLLVTRLIQERQLTSDQLVVEIGSNDGYLLQFYVREGIRVLGIEPATNIARVAQERGIETLNDFFGEPLAQKLKDQGLHARIIHANNVLAHIADLNNAIRGIHLLLTDDGTAVIEVPYLHDLIEKREFDTIYHEHLCYFCLTALDTLFKRHQLFIQDVEHLPLHGGTLRLFIGKAAQQNDSVQEMLKREAALGMNHFALYRDFGEQIERTKNDLLDLLHNLKQQGKRIAAYGAAAKGSILLNYFGIGTDVVDFVVDRSPHKQGLFVPGVHLPIFSPDKLLQDQPGLCAAARLESCR